MCKEVNLLLFHECNFSRHATISLLLMDTMNSKIREPPACNDVLCTVIMNDVFGDGFLNR